MDTITRDEALRRLAFCVRVQRDRQGRDRAESSRKVQLRKRDWNKIEHNRAHEVPTNKLKRALNSLGLSGESREVVNDLFVIISGRGLNYKNFPVRCRSHQYASFR